MPTPEVAEKIRTGNTGTVYRGVYDGRPVAVKVLHEHLASDPIVRARFEREGRILTGVRHANIVRVFDVALVDDRPALVMEYLPGGDLRGRTMKPPDAEDLLATLAGALAEIHRRGIVHRDLRPEHILFDNAGSPRIVDFGMASVKDLSGLTRSTVYSSRPGYADPYSWGRGRALPTQDIYSLGCIIHSVLMGAPPATSPFAPASRAEMDQRTEALREKAGQQLADMVSAMIDVPSRRPRTALELLEWVSKRQAPAGRIFTECLHCGAPLPEAAPVCLRCGEAPLDIRLDPDGEYVALRKITEKQEVLQPFLRKLRILSAERIGDIKIIIGDHRMYSRDEQKAGYRLPVRVADGLDPDSAGRLVDALTSGSGSDIRLTRSPMSRLSRVRRGPIIRLRDGIVLPTATTAAIRGLVGEANDESLRSQCRYAVSIAASRLATSQATEYLADKEHLNPLWEKLDAAATSLESTFDLLAGTNLQTAYAELERLEIETGPGSEGAAVETQRRAGAERERIIGLFAQHGETERKAAELEQRIVTACRILESIDPERAPEQLGEIESLLA